MILDEKRLIRREVYVLELQIEYSVRNFGHFSERNLTFDASYLDPHRFGIHCGLID